MTDEPTKRSGESALTLAWVPIAYAVVGLRSAIRSSPITRESRPLLLGLVGIVPASNAAWGGRWDLGVQMPGVCRTGSTRCGIDWSILPESKSDAIASDPAFELGRR